MVVGFYPSSFFSFLCSAFSTLNYSLFLFYGRSIKTINKKGKAIYIVGNRCVKDIQLPTDQFVAEQFEYNGFKHCITYERLLGNKSMPLKNSPTNIAGQRKGTMTKEYIVVCEK